MLEHIREEVVQSLAQEQWLVLATYGESGLQAGRFPCQADGLHLYLLAPATSEVLFNLGPGRPLIALGESWQAHGLGHVIPADRAPTGLSLLKHPNSRWCVLVVIQINRFEKAHPQGWGFSESIDLG